MKRIQIWVVEEDSDQRSRAIAIQAAEDTETEKRLEDLLVASPKSLLDGVTIVGRQVPTAGGPLDLVGIDQEGRLVIFELKRGTLTRDAVSQVLDYASDLAAGGADHFARLIEEYSGQGGVDRIDDFQDWYGREYPNSDNILAQSPRMVLVGVGADERATRIVNFLATAGIDITLLTFHAFRNDGKLLLARHVETIVPATRSEASSQTKAGNLQALLALAAERGVKDLLLEVADFVEAYMPCYRWPGKTAFSFSLQGRTDEGRPTLHSYLTLWANRGEPGAVAITFPPRADVTAPEAMARFVDRQAQARRTESSWMSIEVVIDSQTWPTLRESLGELLAAITEEWRREEARAETDERSDGGEDRPVTQAGLVDSDGAGSPTSEPHNR